RQADSERLARIEGVQQHQGVQISHVEQSQYWQQVFMSYYQDSYHASSTYYTDQGVVQEEEVLVQGSFPLQWPAYPPPPPYSGDFQPWQPQWPEVQAVTSPPPGNVSKGSSGSKGTHGGPSALAKIPSRVKAMVGDACKVNMVELECHDSFPELHNGLPPLKEKRMQSTRLNKNVPPDK
ncbi:hypothetical protein LINPERPRIM_LOCUS24753, partial [Linum perenne]